MFERNGFVNAGPLISEAEADQLANEILTIIERREDSNFPQPLRIANLSREAEKPIWQIVNIWQASEAFSQLLKNAKLKHYISKLTGKSDFRIWHDQVQYKPVMLEAAFLASGFAKVACNEGWNPIDGLDRS